ncbi:ClpP Protease subunit of ATP-dependent Clp proteases [uncultured Caudovirales phage]|uniref:ClpP Protease subunit of ATP-dependent Clp proteases n=1 Tax=uncultured Caudovirales phage TaxID=2100421 RepID=A0A6J5S3M0_9CAUD|nr:ClpP Protease subunit of ATP-dependent Clp proteases [uncultured Caudovirales phage]
MLCDEKRNLMVWLGSVNEDMHGFVIDSLVKLNATKQKRITFVLSTEGGDTAVAFALYDLIRSNAKPVRIIVNGTCASSGTLILQAGSERLAFEHSHFLIHFGEQGGSSEAEFKFDQRQHAKWVELMTLGTKGKTSQRDMEQMHRGETYLMASEALLHGLIDGITKEIQ